MSSLCEYELRCQNSDKCYRCYDQKLLKLPEDKNKNKNNKNKVFRHEVANAEDSWKDLEQNVADSLKRVPTMQETRRSRRSGALWFEQGDVVDSILHPECKERTGTELKSGERSLSVQRGWLEKASAECQNTGKLMCLPFRFKGDEQIYNIMKFQDIAELVTMMKAYIMDNEAKAKEIEALRLALNMDEEVKVGDIVSYRDNFKDKVITGRVISIAKILDHIDKKLLGKSLYYVSEGQEYIPVPVLEGQLLT